MSCVKLRHRSGYCVGFGSLTAIALTGLSLAGFALVDRACAAETGTADAAPLADEISPPKFLATWGQEGTGDGQFKAPIGIAINALDEVFVTDAKNSCVQRFTRDGKFLDKVATGSFPGGIAIDRGGLIYVAVMMDHKISVFRHKSDATGAADGVPAFELVREWGKKGTGDGEFDQPGGLAFGPDGTLFVCDQVNHRMQRFTPEGKFLTKWGEYGDAPGSFGAPEPTTHRVGGPCMAAVDREGNIHTTEPTAGRIQRFTLDGQYLGSWGSNQVRVGAFGGGKNLQGPIAILFDRDNCAWISATNHRVQLFTAAGHYLTGLGTTSTAGNDPGQFRTPHIMAFDSQGVLYVVDTQNYRVQSFAFEDVAKR
jgi:sugar lactone lactonase YvrE